MRRLPVVFVTVLALLAAALPVFAEEGDPLANSVLLPGWLGWVLVGLAILLGLGIRFLSSRRPS